MHPLRKLLLLTAATLAATALGATPASAQSVTIVQEPGGNACNPSCAVHITGGTTLTAHVPGLGEITGIFCSDEFDVALSSAGTGSFTDEELAGPSCSQAPCENWTVNSITEALGSGEEVANISFCLRDAGGTEHKRCTINVHIEHLGGHEYALSSAGQACVNHQGIPVEVSGSWTIEGGIELLHSDPRSIGVDRETSKSSAS